MKKFPEHFLWGSATASYQVEGGIENNDWARAAQQGRVPVCGKACDHYNRYETDFDIIQTLGHNTHKISLEWSRIEPQENVFDEKEIEHYRRVIDALHRRNIKPIINIWHFTIPQWLADKGGFISKETPALFARYAAFVTERLGEKADMWITINEPLVFSSNGFMRGSWPPFRKNIFLFLKAISILTISHHKAYTAMKKIRPELRIGIAKNNIYFHANNNPFNILWASFFSWFWNRRFFDAIRDHQDFIGINYYFHKKFGGREKYQKTDMNWDIYPDGLYHVLREVAQYKKPVIVVENGLADEEDTRRASFIEQHLNAVYRAIQDGVDIIGYLHWSLLDNYEWVFGFEKRFGLVEVQYESQIRTVRPSAFIYKKICNENALETHEYAEK